MIIKNRGILLFLSISFSAYTSLAQEASTEDAHAALVKYYEDHEYQSPLCTYFGIDSSFLKLPPELQFLLSSFVFLSHKEAFYPFIVTEPLKILHHHTDLVTCLRFTPDGTRCISGSYDTSVAVWDVKTGERLSTFSPYNCEISCLALNHGTLCAIASFKRGTQDGQIGIWDTAQWQKIKDLKGHTAVVNDMKFIGSTHKLLVASNDATIKVWNTNDDTCEITVGFFSPGTFKGFYSADITDDQETIVTAVGGATGVYLWQKINNFASPTQTMKDIQTSHIRFIDKGPRLLLTDNNTVACVDTHTTPITQSILGTHANHSGDFSVNIHDLQVHKRYAISASDDKTACLWDITQGHKLASFENHPDSVLRADIHPLNRLVATSSAGSQTDVASAVYLWKIPSSYLQGHCMLAQTLFILLLHMIKTHQNPRNINYTAELKQELALIFKTFTSDERFFLKNKFFTP